MSHTHQVRVQNRKWADQDEPALKQVITHLTLDVFAIEGENRDRVYHEFELDAPDPKSFKPLDELSDDDLIAFACPDKIEDLKAKASARLNRKLAVDAGERSNT